MPADEKGSQTPATFVHSQNSHESCTIRKPAIDKRRTFEPRVPKIILIRLPQQPATRQGAEHVALRVVLVLRQPHIWRGEGEEEGARDVEAGVAPLPELGDVVLQLAVEVHARLPAVVLEYEGIHSTVAEQVARAVLEDQPVPALGVGLEQIDLRQNSRRT